MENEMIERVSRAVFPNEWLAIDQELIPAGIAQTARAGLLARARDGIKAMRELPESLWDDGGALDPDVIGYDPSPTTSWETIIDAALGIAKIPDILD